MPKRPRQGWGQSLPMASCKTRPRRFQIPSEAQGSALAAEGHLTAVVVVVVVVVVVGGGGDGGVIVV